MMHTNFFLSIKMDKIRYIFWNTIEKILINKPDIILCPEINRLILL